MIIISIQVHVQLLNVCIHATSTITLYVLIATEYVLRIYAWASPLWPNVSASRAEDPGFESRLRRDFWGSSHTNDLKLALQLLPCQAAGIIIIGSVLGLGGPVSVYCDWVRWKVWSATVISVWQHVKLSKQIRPWDTLTCCWDIKQPTPPKNKQKRMLGFLTPKSHRLNQLNNLEKHTHHGLHSPPNPNPEKADPPGHFRLGLFVSLVGRGGAVERVGGAFTPLCGQPYLHRRLRHRNCQPHAAIYSRDQGTVACCYRSKVLMMLKVS